jgi:hypothetical protein
MFIRTIYIVHRYLARLGIKIYLKVTKKVYYNCVL